MEAGKIIWKRVALLLAGAVMLCGLIGLAYYTLQGPLRSALSARFWKTDPVQADEVARALLDFDLPPGYQPEKVMKLKEEASADAVILASQAHPSDMIFIGRTPDGILANEDWRTKYEERGARAIADQLYDTETISTTTTTIRGQPVTLRLLEGTDQNGQSVKQLACMFQGKSGEILLVIVAGQTTWDQAMVDHFLNSIR